MKTKTEMSFRTDSHISHHFSLLVHTGQTNLPDHWDLLLEIDCESKKVPCWQLDKNLLDMLAGQSCNALKIFDHRRKYLNYSGALSGNRGEVKLLACGKILDLRDKEHDLDIISLSLGINSRIINIELTRLHQDDSNLYELEVISH